MERLGAAVSTSGARVVADAGAEALVVDSGDVVGLLVRTNDGLRAIRARGGVILATGGFIHNEAMVAEHCPLAHVPDPAWRIGTPNDDGRGIRMGVGAGATTTRLDSFECALPLGPPHRLARGILVNRDGERFINEDAYTGRIGLHALRDNDGFVYMITDDVIHEPNAIGLRIGYAAATPEELAGDLGIPPDALARTLREYNEAATRGHDPAFHKRAPFLQPIGAPPASGIGAIDLRVDHGAIYATFTLGGLVTDPDGAARDSEGRRIPGLYAVGIGDETAERKGRVDRTVVNAQVDGADAARRRRADGLKEGCPLVECRVVTAGRGLVVLAQRAREGVRRNPEVAGQFFWSGRGVADPESDRIRLVNHVIGDHVDEAVVVAKGVESDATGVGILVDESLTVAVDEDSPCEAVGRPEGQRTLEGVEPGRRCAGAYAHADPAPVVVRGADPPGRVRDVGQGAMLGDHRLVVDETASGQDHPTTGSDGTESVICPHQQADDVPAVDDQRLGAGVGHHAGAAGRYGRTEAFHEEVAGGVDTLGLVSARTGTESSSKG